MDRLTADRLFLDLIDYQILFVRYRSCIEICGKKLVGRSGETDISRETVAWKEITSR